MDRKGGCRMDGLHSRCIVLGLAAAEDDGRWEEGGPCPPLAPTPGFLDSPQRSLLRWCWDKMKREELWGGGETSVCTFRARTQTAAHGMKASL